MKLADLLDRLGQEGVLFEVVGSIGDVTVDCITDDSRDLTENSVFAITALSIQHLESAIARKPALIIAPRSMLDSPELRKSSHSAILCGSKPARSLPEWILASIAGIFYEHPDHELQITAVTGTNGKTSISRMIYHAWKQSGLSCGVIGTLGATLFQNGMETQIQTGYTTPRSYQLLALLRKMKDAGIEKVALEASSEALALGRLETIQLHQALFCGLSVDHLDYHGTMQRYFMAKVHLFTLLARSQGQAIIQDLSKTENDAYSKKLQRYIKRNGTKIQVVDEFQQFRLNVPVDFNQRNANLAWKASGLPFDDSLFESMPDVPGRMNRIQFSDSVDAIIDYAHTPDALYRILSQLRGRGYDRLYCVFGCGGNRDPSKRVMMGRAALELSTHVIVTDDNPRKEDPSSIRQAILKARDLPDLNSSAEIQEIADRRQAIRHALLSAQKRQKGHYCVLIAGKGHEDYQIYGTEKRHFSDQEVVMELKQELSY